MWGTAARMSSIDSETLGVAHMAGVTASQRDYIYEISPYTHLSLDPSAHLHITVVLGQHRVDETDNSCYHAQFLKNKNDALLKSDPILIRPMDQSKRG
jgi:hypothetical protein